MNWKVGDRARVNCPRSKAHGIKVVVSSELVCGLLYEPDGSHNICEFHHVDGICGKPDAADVWAFEPHELIPIDEEKGSWEAIKDIWNPLEKV